MVGLYKIHDRVIVLVVVITSMIMIISQGSHARLLDGLILQKNDPTMEEFEVQYSRFNGKNRPSASSIPEDIIGKYRSALLNFLPKGPVPPSAPSGGINNSED
ncbi:hypothetical protein ACOSQ4_029491 [Xanthoceras sorbifolium]